MDPINATAKFEVCSFTHSRDNWGYFKPLGNLWIRRSGSSKVIDFGINWKHVCDFLLVCHSNLGPISHRFRDVQHFLLRNWPHPYSTLISGVFPLHHITHVGFSPRISLKLFGFEIIFEEFQPMWSRYLNITNRWIDDILCHNCALHSIAR